jgi:peptidoglycan/xylan/chitin deacetylase (PgdA/CDA1 family)
MTAPMDVGAAAREPYDDEYFLYERYHGPRGNRSPLLTLHYALKPVVPRRLQLALRRAYAARQATRRFPAWPIEPLLVERWEAELRERVLASARGAVPIVNFWPNRARFGFVLTHDVEGPEGIANIERVLEVERKHGLVSSWNFVAESYDIPDGTFEMLGDSGCEIGLHGIKHNGRLFQSRARFEADLPKIRKYVDAWTVDGFRSPATGRNADWMDELPVAYDSSFPDSDPFEPQPGGCCSIFPFRFGDVVELPVTLAQDHTLFVILGERTPRLWVEKTAWIARHHGLVNLITHPDYLTDPALLAIYDEFLAYLRSWEEAWHALPREVAAWWRVRDELTCEADEHGGVRITGPADARATIAWARVAQHGELVVEA